MPLKLGQYTIGLNAGLIHVFHLDYYKCYFLYVRLRFWKNTINLG